jgi:hypothetical protein
MTGNKNTSDQKSTSVGHNSATKLGLFHIYWRAFLTRWAVVSKGSELKMSPNFILIFLAKTFQVLKTWKV